MFQITVERKKKNWTQTELARRAGLDTPTVNRLETGMTKPYPGWKKKLGAALGVDPELLFQEVESYADTTPDSH